MSAVPTPDPLREAYEERVRGLTQTIETRERQLSILSAVAARTHSAEDIEQILDITLDEILRGLGLTAAWVFMGSQEDQKLHFAASRGVSASYREQIQREGVDDCLCPEVFWTGHRMEARNTTQCPRMPTIVEGLREPVAHACIPLQFEGQSKGVLNVAARPGERFGDDELRFLETLGHQVCIAVERSRHLKAEKLRNQEARALATINKAIGGSLDPDAVLKAVGQSACEILEADRVQVLLGSEPSRMRVAHLSGLPHPELKQGQILDLVAIGAKGAQWAIAERTMLLVNDWAKDSRVNNDFARRWSMAAVIVMPLIARGQRLGLLVVTREAAEPWTPPQLEVAESLAAQASLAIENARLYGESRDAYGELKSAQRRLLQNQRMVVLGTFASGLAHEVRNPLNSIGLQLSILERRIGRLDGELPGELYELAGIIRSEIRRLDTLVGEFLLFSRTNRVQFAPANLEDLIDEVVRLMLPEAQQAGVVLRRERLSAEPIPLLPMDAEKMKQVVINLIRNAIEALPKQGIATVETGLVEGHGRVVVRDNGPGLPRNVDIFQLFVTTKPKGTGLGLSIVQQIVSEHGGDVTAWSEPGEGATFTVSLPLVGAEAGALR
jgi:signal transduction histidine kinase